jgi:hypothetical protein
MSSRATLTTLAAIAMAMVLPVAASAAGCPLDSFGVHKLRTCEDSGCNLGALPAEIAAIKRGLYSEYIGLFINDGIGERIGVDLDAGETVFVERYSGPRVKNAPHVAQPTPQLSRRESLLKGKRVIDISRRAPLARETAEDIVCAANAAWTDKTVPPAGGFSDLAVGVVLVDGATRRVEGGVIAMTPAAQALYDRLQALIGRSPPVSVPLPSFEKK